MLAGTSAIRGLSPRVRGNLPAAWNPHPAAGSIPACAGEPGRTLTLSAMSGVYPRVCGGTHCSNPRFGITQGLSPRVRGNPAHACACAWQPGSIPACAGEPAVAPTAAMLCRVYPRVCGGTVVNRMWVYRLLGLSPRVRGNPGAYPAPPFARGSIPACAGEPLPTALSASSGWVYPRVCGGTCSSTLLSVSRQGLSPRVRGNLADSTHALNAQGSIPACAGEPAAQNAIWGYSLVYPRVCGGTAAIPP